MEFIKPSCPVCWNTINPDSNNYCITECNHSFHLSCFSKSIACKNYNCPICRATIIDKNELVSLQSEESEDEEESEAGEEEEADQSDNVVNNQSNILLRDTLNKLENHLQISNIKFKNLIELICFLEHEEFENKTEFQLQADFIYGKFRQVLNTIDPRVFITNTN